MKRNQYKLTATAARAIKALFEAGFVARDLAMRIREDERCFDRRNKRKPHLPPITNKPFNEAAYHFLGRVVLCDAVDLYNSYCRDVLELAAHNNRAALPTALASAKHFGDALKKAAKKKSDPADALLDVFNARYIAEGLVRQAIHTHLGINQFPETELLCLCRNILVHKRGVDAEGAIPARLKEIGTERSFIGAQGFRYGHLPIAVNGQKNLIVDDQVGLWSAEIMVQQISAMDQEFAAKYRLPTGPAPKHTIGRIFVTENM